MNTTFRMRNTITAFLDTGLATVLLALFLMPFLYMILSSLKTNQQMTQLESPIWPASQKGGVLWTPMAWW